MLKKKIFFQRCISFLLVIFFVVSFFSTNVYAESGVLTNLKSSDTYKPENGGIAYMTIKGTDLVQKDISAKVLLKGERRPEIESTFKGEEIFSGKMYSYSIAFSPNTTSEAQIYEVYVSVDGGNTFSPTKLEFTVEKSTPSTIPDVTPTSTSIIDSVNNSNLIHEYNDTKIDFTISGKNLTPDVIKSFIYQNGVQDINLGKSIVLTKIGNDILGTITLAENKSSKDLIYSFKFNLDDSSKFSSSNIFDVTIKGKPAVANVSKILGIKDTSFSLQNIGGDVDITLYTLSDLINENVKANITLDGNKVTIPYTVTGEKASRNVNFKFPNNEDTSIKNYEIVFNFGGSTTEFDITKKVLVSVAPTIQNLSKISDVTTRTPILPIIGGEANITVKGEELIAKDVTIKVFKKVNSGEVEVPSITEGKVFHGLPTALSTKLIFPASGNLNEETYVIKVGLNNKATHSLEIKVSNNGTTIPFSILIPKTTVIDKASNTIIIQYNENIFQAMVGELKNNILLDTDGSSNFKNLLPEDSVIIDGDKLIIKSSLANEIIRNGQFKILQGTLKEKTGIFGKEFIGALFNNSPTIFNSTFIKGEILQSSGGDVEILLEGVNLINSLNPNRTRVEVQRVDKPEITINSEVIGEGEKQTLKFTLPQNNGDISITYLVRISTDGGRTYSSKFGISNYHMGNKLASTVLPKNISSDKKPTLSYMTIQSYGTTGGTTSKPDPTHAEVPVLQESKKTLVHVYGSNLDAKVTKIRVVDENGVIWTPVREPNSDSMDQFILVAFDGTGITGSGNTQLIELIAPRNIKGNNTYIYQIAVDGINFDTSITVTARVLDDLEPGKHIAKDKLREIKVNLLDSNGNLIENPVDEKGNKIENSKVIKGYSWLKFNVVGINPYKIKGYELVPCEATTTLKSDNIFDIIGGTANFNFVYKSLATPINPIPEIIIPDPKPEIITTPKKDENSDKTVPTKVSSKDSKVDLPNTGSDNSTALPVAGIIFSVFGIAYIIIKKKIV